MSELPSTQVSTLLADDLALQSLAPGRSVGDFWRTVWRRRWLCAAVAIPIWIMGTVTPLVLQRSFTAHTLVAVSSAQPDLAATDRITPVEQAASLREPDVDGEIQRMTSNQALSKVAQDLKLKREFDITGKLWNGVHFTAVTLRQDWNALIQGDWNLLLTKRPGRLNDVETIAEERPQENSEQEIIDFLRQRLKIDVSGRSAAVDISFTGHDPNLASEVVNAIAENYIESRQMARSEQAKRATTYLKERAAQLSTEVDAAEQAVEAFRSENVLQDGRNIEQLKAEMDETNRHLAAARIAEGTAKAKLEAVEARVQKAGIVGALESGTSLLDDRLREIAAAAHTKLAGSIVDHGAAHPDTRRAESEYSIAQSEIARVAQARLERLRSDVTVAHQQVQTLGTSLQTFRSDFDRLSTALVTLKGLEGHAKVSRVVYEGILNRLKLTEQVGFNEAKNWVISRATPPVRPSSPNVILIVSISILVGAGAALSLALLAEHRTSGTVLSSQHVADKGLRTLGIIPDLGRRAGALKQVLVASTGHNGSAFSESIGSIYTSVMELAHREQSCLVLLVTSSLPFEGKSTTITALAAKIASANKQVLLIDADLRAPRLHRAFGISTDRGVTECLDPSQNPSDSIHIDPKTGISILTAGPKHLTPQNVLRSPRLSEAIETWRNSYDFVLIDSPPVLPISDARILVPLADYCIFVTHWRKTRWTAAIRALSLLRDSGAQFAGIVVSKVNVKQLATYGFADSEIYGRAYKRYSSLGSRKHG
jgi:succinoglycan biosynthesis transport protein ExoP